MLSGTVHATPSCDTFELVIALWTSLVFCRSPPGRDQPWAAVFFAAGLAAVPAPAAAVTAGADLEVQDWVLPLLVPLLPQPPATRPAAGSRIAPATTGRLDTVAMSPTPSGRSGAPGSRRAPRTPAGRAAARPAGTPSALSAGSPPPTRRAGCRCGGLAGRPACSP